MSDRRFKPLRTGWGQKMNPEQEKFQRLQRAKAKLEDISIKEVNFFNKGHPTDPYPAVEIEGWDMEEGETVEIGFEGAVAEDLKPEIKDELTDELDFQLERLKKKARSEKVS